MTVFMGFSFSKFRENISERQHKARLHALEKEAQKEATELRREGEQEQVERRLRNLRKTRAKLSKRQNMTASQKTAAMKKRKSLDSQIKGLAKKLGKF